MDKSRGNTFFLAMIGISSIMVLIGGSMLAHANETLDALIVVILFYVAGFFPLAVFFPGRKPELRAFVLTYGICVLMGGMSQLYSLFNTGDLQSTPDAQMFFSLISASPPFTEMADLPVNFNSPLAVVLWQLLYKGAWSLGLSFGLYTAITLNSFVVAFSGFLTVRIARDLFGNDTRKLHFVGLLFSLCGMFWLFGAIMIRDCFILLINTLVLWALVRWVEFPRSVRLYVAVIGGCISGFCMWYLRKETIYLYGVFFVIALSAWYVRERINAQRLSVICITIAILLVSYSYIEQLIGAAREEQVTNMQRYGETGLASSRSGSLGAQLILVQPMPVRLVVGSVYIVLYPIPLWAYFFSGASEYNILKNCHGIFQVLTIPLFIAALLLLVRNAARDIQAALPYIFLASSFVVSILAVASTSIETRHYGQFLPAYLICMAIPDLRKQSDRSLTFRIAAIWFGIIAVVQVLWAVLRFV